MEKQITFGITIGILLIAVFVGVSLVSAFATALWASMINSLVGFSTLGNFTFASLFTATGVMPVLLSVALLGSLLALVLGAVYVGVKYLKGGHR